MKKKLFNVVCSVALVSAMTVMPVSAYTDSTESVTYEDFTEASTEDCLVDVEVGGGFTVTIPKKITLSGADGTAEFTVTVKGDIAGTETVTVAPDETFNLEQSPKDPVLTGVSQEKTSFDCTDLVANDNAGTTTNGRVFADGTTQAENGVADVGTLSAGSWEGTFNFNIALEDSATGGATEATDFALTAENMTTAGISVVGNAVTIPDTFVFDDVTYKITSIASGMWSTTDVTSITYKDVTYTTTDGTNNVSAFNALMVSEGLNANASVDTTSANAVWYE